MSCHFLSKLSELSIVDWFKLAGFTLIIIATFLSTVTIPNIDKKIEKIDDRITSFKDGRLLTAISAANYDDRFTRRRIELFEANQIAFQTHNKQAVYAVRARAIDQTVSLIKQWAFLHGGSEAEALKTKAENSVKQILADENTDIDQKLDDLDKILEEQQAGAGKRLAVAHDKWHQDESEQAQMESTRISWNRCFVWLQILGLIFVSGAEIADKFK